MSNLPKDPEIVHQSNGIEFYVSGGAVEARVKGGPRLPEGLIPSLLLLDIAMSLDQIRNWGIAQERDGGQRVNEAY